MGEKFFYDWTKVDVWNAIDLVVSESDLQKDDQAKLYEKFVKLCDQEGISKLLEPIEYFIA